MKIGVIDSGLGNVGSVLNMIKKIGYHSIKISKTTDFQNVDKIIIPGVGSFDSGIQKLQEKDFISILLDQANEGKHILGICLGIYKKAKTFYGNMSRNADACVIKRRRTQRRVKFNSRSRKKIS